MLISPLSTQSLAVLGRWPSFPPHGVSGENWQRGRVTKISPGVNSLERQKVGKHRKLVLKVWKTDVPDSETTLGLDVKENETRAH